MNKQLFTTIEILIIGGLILVVLYWGGVFEPRPAPTPTQVPPATSTQAATTPEPATPPALTRTTRPTIVPSITPTNPPLVQPTGLIAFETTRDGNTEIYTTTVDGGIQTNLTNNPADDFNFAWSPDGSRIAFFSTRTGWLEVFVMDADGSNLRQLSRNIGTNSAYTPPLVWSPDGEHLLGLKYKVWLNNSDSYSQGLDVIETDGSGTRSIYDDEDAYISGLAWLPGAQQIVMNINAPQTCGIYTGAFTSGPVEFTRLKDSCDILEWSPDGQWAAYTTRDSLFIYNDDGTEAYSVPEMTGACGCGLFDWSPDQRHILYVNNSGAVDAISLDGVRQISLRLLVNSGGSYYNRGTPNWAPDSQWLTFIDTRQLDVSIVNIYDPTNRILVTRTNNNYAPQWQPKP